MLLVAAFDLSRLFCAKALFRLGKSSSMALKGPVCKARPVLIWLGFAMPLWDASDKASLYSCDPVRVMPLALASSRTIPTRVSPDLVTRVARASANLVFSKTLAKLVLKAPDDVGSPVLTAA